MAEYLLSFVVVFLIFKGLNYVWNLMMKKVKERNGK